MKPTVAAVTMAATMAGFTMPETFQKGAAIEVNMVLLPSLVGWPGRGSGSFQRPPSDQVDEVDEADFRGGDDGGDEHRHGHGGGDDGGDEHRHGHDRNGHGAS